MNLEATASAGFRYDIPTFTKQSSPIVSCARAKIIMSLFSIHFRIGTGVRQLA